MVAAEARRALAALIDPGAGFELRALPSRSCWTGRDLDAAIAWAETRAGRDSLYYLLNPIRPDLNKCATNADVIARRLILIDCDSRHPADVPADDAERAGSWALAEAVMDGRAACGWPAPAVVDSGNGFQLLYRCELSNSALARQWVAGLLRGLAGRHNTDLARVDDSVHNAARLARLPGTINRKGTAGPESGRAHRLAILLSLPDPFDVVPAELIRAASEGPRAPQEPPPPAGTTERPRTRGIRLTGRQADRAGAWYAAAIQGEARKVAQAPAGTRHNALRAAARTLAGSIHTGIITVEAIRSALLESARRVGLDDVESRAVLDWAIADGAAHPIDPPDFRDERRGHDDSPGEAPAEGPDAAPAADDPNGYGYPLIIGGREITPKRVRWLWEGRVPYGFLTLLAGRTGVGKSFIALDLAARLTTGDEIPGGAGECFEPGRVLVIGEDSHEYVLAPRLIEAGADMGRVSFMSWAAMAEYSLSNSTMLDDTHRAAGRPELVIIDPPTNFLAAKDEHKNAEVRQILMIVSTWAMARDVVVLFITHCNKGGGKDREALSRIMGSVAWATTCRIAHLLTPDPEEDGRSLFLPMKSNIGRLPPGLAYRIVGTDTLARVEWLGEVDIDADDALSGEKRKPRGVVAVEWLAEQFRDQGEWESAELTRAAAEAGISRVALFAPEVMALPIRRRQHTHADGRRSWTWIADPGWPPPPHDPRAP
jgi:hypothetical protein